jgi:NAD+ synthase
VKLLEINPELVRRLLVQFIREHTTAQGFSRVVLGLSGGLDSTVCAWLAAEALGADGCVGVFLPHAVSDPASLRDARTVASQLKLPTRLVEITPMVASFSAAFPDMTPLQLGNAMARIRMMALYQISAEERGLVVGTSNKTELLLGYGTLHGDLACAFDPLGDLYKTQVRALAAHLGVPEAIRRKAPSADLWAGQSDEGELGLTYAEADRFLVRWVDGRYTRDDLLKEGFAEEFTDRVIEKVVSQQFKRTPPLLPKISSRTLGADFLYPRDWMK